jgi:lipopolysaccharide export system protein LptC
MERREDMRSADAMTRFSDSRTRVVTWLKIILPLVALGLLSTLFLLARTADPDLAIRYSDVDVTELSKDQQVTGPAFSGTTRDGASLRVTAARLRPREGDADRLDAATVAGRIELPAGASADMTAPAAIIDTEEGSAQFLGGVTILTSDGYRLETETLNAALGETDIVAENAVRATGPIGTLDAGGMRITQDDVGGYVVVFIGGVRLVYDANRTEEQP